MKTRMIIFEGIDGSGKDTLIAAFHKATNWRHFIINRGPATYIVYGQLHIRPLDYCDYYLFDKQLAAVGCVMVYLEASKPEIIRRNIKKADGDIEFDDIDEIIKRYENFIKITYMRVIRINTEIHTVDECVGVIMKELCCG